MLRFSKPQIIDKAFFRKNFQAIGEAADLPDYISTKVGNSAKNTSLADVELTYFITSQNGNSKLYEVLNDGAIALIATQGSMKTGNIETMVVGDWTSGSNQDGLMNVSLYSGVLTTEQMGSLIPEPSAFGLLAGLGVLALVGTRRRRK